jgi:formylglycine-generating enzyme
MATQEAIPAPAPSRAPAENMVWIPGGTFRMGSDRHYAEEAPAHKVKVAPFWMSAYAVTNAEFARFVDATGYTTVAERPADPADYPGAQPELLVPASVVFKKTRVPVDLGNPYNWWTYVAGADWRHPRGPATTIDDLLDHPVVHVAFEDAEAYTRWRGQELPTEAEWEFAARGGLEDAEFAWGTEYMPNGTPMANTWQGEFPWQNLVEDGYEWTAPVGSFLPNGFGSSTWPATSGSGRPTGTKITARSRARAARSITRAAASGTRAAIRERPPSRSPAR